MRRAQGDGPATPREIYDAITSGGRKFEAKDEATALVGMRAMLRKRGAVFHKISDTGTYGLTAWYEHIKNTSKTTAVEDDDDDAGETEEEPDPKKETAAPKKAAAGSVFD